MSFIRKTFVVAWVASGLFGGALPLQAQSKTAIVPKEWYPALTPSIRAALEQLKTAATQTEMNDLGRQVAELTDAQLYIAYVRLYERLSTKERAALLKEQTAWLEERAEAALGRGGIERRFAGSPRSQ